MKRPILLWFRQDLRLADHKALQAAIQSGAPVIPVCFPDEPDYDHRHDPALPPVPPPAASRWWLGKSLESLARDLEGLNSRLILKRGKADHVLPALCDETHAQAVFATRMITPSGEARDRHIADNLPVPLRLFDGGCLCPPGSIKTKSDTPYARFTPFWNALRDRAISGEPLPRPDHISPPDHWPQSQSYHDLDLFPSDARAFSFAKHWTPGEGGARARLYAFLEEAVESYAQCRDIPSLSATSRLSPHLHFGEISPQQVWLMTKAARVRAGDPEATAAMPFLRQLGWREFAHHLLHATPSLPDAPMDLAFMHFPWRDNQAYLGSWQSGLTGYPFVDAGMRELKQTGFMHNRLRMIVASFLVKNLMIHWRHGARWFETMLVDADIANNSLGWQWVAGSGPDAAPFFRIFNPVTQGERFDPNGVYIRRWVPELAHLPAHFIHKPWQAPDTLLARSGVVLGKTYPRPLIDLARTRQQALTGYEAVKAARVKVSQTFS